MPDSKSRPSESENPAAGPQRLVSFGWVVKPHGLKGLVKVKPHRKDSHAIETIESLWLGRNGDWQRVSVRSVRRDRFWFLVELEGCSTKEAAEKWRGAEVAISRGDLPRLEEDELYLADCVGLVAVTKDGRPLGRIEGLLETGGTDVFEILDQDTELLVPACAPYLVDVVDDTVIFDQIEGLPTRRLRKKPGSR